MSGRDESLAQNESDHRQVNEQIEQRVLLFAGEEPSFGIVCECDRRECDRRLVVNVADYEQIREDPLLFIVVPGHEDEQVEDVVEGDRREYLIVRKRGDAADEAERSDPR
jgi:hypothetical protein